MSLETAIPDLKRSASGPPMPTASPAIAEQSQPAATARTRLRRWFYRRVLRTGMTAFHVSLAMLRVIGRRPRRLRDGEGCEILLTGTFYSANWINAHLRPLAASSRCARVYVVTSYPIPPTPKLILIQPFQRLEKILGMVPARLLTFAWLAVRKRPHVLGGFHLLVNGLASALIARIAGSRSLYFCVGGPAEVLGGGIWSENRIFSRLEVPDPVVESQLVRSVAAFDTVITMGSRAVDFFKSRGIKGDFHVVSGGIDVVGFRPTGQPPTADLVFVGRLAQIKRVDIFLRAVELVSRRIPGVRAVIVGDGEQRESLEQLARDLNISERINFAGQQSDVASILQRSRLFVLTSDSEGLALSLMEAMTCGLPAVVSDVGDLGDLVQDDVNGHLVPPRDFEQFAARISDLLADEPKRLRFADAARESAAKHQLPNVVRQWDAILSGFQQGVS